MKKMLIFAAILSFAVACGGSEETSGESREAEKTTASATPAPATPTADGEKIWKTNCIACHGLYGDMGASGAFNLKVSQLSLEERINVITNGRNTMAAWGSLLKPEEIKAVAEYTMTLKEDQ